MKMKLPPHFGDFLGTSIGWLIVILACALATGCAGQHRPDRLFALGAKNDTPCLADCSCTLALCSPGDDCNLCRCSVSCDDGTRGFVSYRKGSE